MHGRRDMSAPKFEPVPRLPAHHLHGASLQDGPQLLTVTALGDSVALHATVGGVSATCLDPSRLVWPILAVALAGSDTEPSFRQCMPFTHSALKTCV